MRNVVNRATLKWNFRATLKMFAHVERAPRYLFTEEKYVRIYAEYKIFGFLEV